MINKYIFKDLHYGQLFSLKEDGPDVLYRQKISSNSSRKLVTYFVNKGVPTYTLSDSDENPLCEVILQQPLITNYVSFLIRTYILDKAIVVDKKVYESFNEFLYDLGFEPTCCLNVNDKIKIKNLFLEFFAIKNEEDSNDSI